MLGIEDVALAPDAAIDAALADGVPEPTICYGAFQQICVPQPVNDLLLTTMTIDTTSSPVCAPTISEVCVVTARKLLIDSNSVVTVAGPRPLVLLAEASITVDGTLDGASTATRAGPGASATTCTGILPLGNSGGAGGSFGARGGTGGKGSVGAGGSSGPLVVPTTFVGGCRGQAGANGTSAGQGGAGGGVIGLISPTILITGRINLSGAGGGGAGPVDHGAGGGGSGGFLMLDTANLVLTNASVMIANGGGGGEGSGDNTGGTPGNDPVLTSPTTPAPGGRNGSANGGDGGAGGTTGAGAAGTTTTDSGGGGGGGGAGILRTTDPTPILAGVRSPPFS